MANRFKDFDAAWAETASAPLTVKVLGQTYNLPPAIPAKVVLALARVKSDTPEAEVPIGQIMDLLEPFFGPGVLAEWLDKGLDVDQLGDVFRWSMSMYSGVDPDAIEPVDPEAETDPNS